MNTFSKLTLAGMVTSALILSGCGDSSSSGSSGSSSINVSGTAEAPGGAVALFEQKPFYQQALEFFVTPLAAGITGLQPVGGALVELIRVDDAGNQVGDVLTSTTTSITGDYRLTLPQGVNLAGNLIVRITGTGVDMRAQVVEQEVDINPVSEFILQKFIETGADLDQLEVTDVVKLTGRAEQFDLTAGADLTEMFSVLESQIGSFIESEVEVVASQGASTAALTGEYALMGFEWMLHDSDGVSGGTGTLAHDAWLDSLSFTGSSSSTLDITYNGGEWAYSNLMVNSGGRDVYYEVGSDQESEDLSASYTTSGVVAVVSPFEEDLETEWGFGWRWPEMTYTFQQVAGKAVFVGLTHEAGVRYELTDTNGDGQDDAVDPNAKVGDEVGRILDIIFRKPTALTGTDMAGNFGRVYLGSGVTANSIEMETEVNTVTFDNTFTADLAEASGHLLNINLSNGTSSYSATTTAAESGVGLNISATGAISDGGVIGYVNDDASLAVFIQAEGCNSDSETCASGEFANFEHTTLLRLPSSTPNLTGKKYRLMLVSLLPSAPELTASKFNSYITLSSNTAATLSGRFSSLAMDSGFTGDISIDSVDLNDESLAVTVAANGRATFELDEGNNEKAVLDGFFNQDASMGAFIFGYKEADDSFSELGLAVLVDVTEP